MDDGSCSHVWGLTEATGFDDQLEHRRTWRLVRDRGFRRPALQSAVHRRPGVARRAGRRPGVPRRHHDASTAAPRPSRRAISMSTEGSRAPTPSSRSASRRKRSTKDASSRRPISCSPARRPRRATSRSPWRVAATRCRRTWAASTTLVERRSRPMARPTRRFEATGSTLRPRSSLAWWRPRSTARTAPTAISTAAAAAPTRRSPVRR